MDEICCAVLNKLNQLGEIGNFIIVEKGELFEVLPETEENKSHAVESALKKLRTDGYIEIRYSRGDVFCLAPLKKIEVTEQQAIAKTADFSKKNATIYAVCCFFGSFLGGLLACLIAR